MNEQARSVFLCPDCGGPSAATGEGDAVCSDCEKRFPLPEQVAQKVRPRAVKAESGAIQRNIVLHQKSPSTDFGRVEDVVAPIEPQQDIELLQKERGERRRRLKKRSKPPAKFYLGWLLVWLVAVGVVLLVVSRLLEQFGSHSQNALTIEERLVGEELDFYRGEYPKISQAFRKFLASKSVSMMSESALKTSQLERKMTRHTKEHSVRRPVGGLKPHPVFWNVAFEESPGYVEVVWDSGSSGLFEGVFVKEENAWKLDWEHYVRYNSENWTLFRQQLSSQNSGLFRVYVEKVSEGEDAEFNPWIKVRLLPAYANERRRRLEASEEILIEGDDEISRQISQLFIDSSGQSEGFSKLWQRDDRDMRRAFLRLEWERNSITGEEKMVIREVLADHWRSLDLGASSMEPREQKKSTDDE